MVTNKINKVWLSTWQQIHAFTVFLYLRLLICLPIWTFTLYGRDAYLNTFALNENCYCAGFFIYICSIKSCNSSVCHAILSMPWLIYITFMEQLCLFWSSGCWMDTRLCCDTDSTAARYMTLRPLHHCCVGFVYYYYMLCGLCGLLVYAIWWSGPPSILCPLEGYFSLLISQFMLLYFALPDLHVRQRLKVLIRFRKISFLFYIDMGRKISNSTCNL